MKIAYCRATVKNRLSVVRLKSGTVAVEIQPVSRFRMKSLAKSLISV